MKPDEGPQLGRLILDGDRQRDAIHIAVAPVTAAEILQPGETVRLVGDSTELVESAEDGSVPKHLQGIGIVDPFLALPVGKGQRFWMLLRPNTITGLRHIWKHPAFTAAANKVASQATEELLKTLRT